MIYEDVIINAELWPVKSQSDIDNEQIETVTPNDSETISSLSLNRLQIL